MSNNDHSNHPHHNQDHSHHHIVSTKTALTVAGSLFFLTVLTVVVSRVDLGVWNFPVAMLVATVKALLVMMFFMDLIHDAPENSVIFGAGFLFLVIFFILTASDLFFRGNVYVKAGTPLVATSGRSSLKNPWISTPELVSHGKELFSQNCVTCHGPEGLGNGVAAAGYNPPPRNFHSQTGWINGRKPSNIFKTLKEGIPGSGMASFGTLPIDDRWALAAYVVSLNSERPASDTQEDVAKIGYDLKTGLAAGGARQEEKTIPIEFAIERMAVAEPAPAHGALGANERGFTSVGGQLYQARCAQCHGEHGEGGVRVRSLGGMPKAYITTAPLLANRESLKSADAFNHVVENGLTGREMPGSADLSGGELSELYTHVKWLAGQLH
ncbi:MAG: c-type cytochrome [Oligoflexia bacterium]|nr:c-type cytochrome [Oligoflexia bacterium]